jgi:hypothetical protein
MFAKEESLSDLCCLQRSLRVFLWCENRRGLEGQQGCLPFLGSTMTRG